MRRVRLWALMAVIVIVATGWGLWRHPSVRPLFLRDHDAVVGLFVANPGSPTEARPLWAGRIVYLKAEPGGLAAWSVAPDGTDRERLGGPLPDPVATWAAAKEFALLADTEGRAWMAGAGYLKQLKLPDLRPETLIGPAQRPGDAAYLYGIARVDDRPVLIKVSPAGTVEAFRGPAPASWVHTQDPNQFVMVIARRDAWQVTSLRYDGGMVSTIEGPGALQRVEYTSGGEQLILHTDQGRHAIDARQWKLAGSTGLWLAGVGSRALLISPSQSGPAVAVAPPDRLTDFEVWPELSRDLQAMGTSGIVVLVDESRDSFLLAAMGSTASPTHQLYAGFLRDQVVVPLGQYPSGRFFGFAGEGFAVSGSVVNTGDERSLQSVRLIRPTGTVQIWDRARIVDWWPRVYGVVVQIERGGQSEVGLLTRHGYDRLAQAPGPLAVYPGYAAAVVIAGSDGRGGSNLRLVDALTGSVTVLDPQPAGAVLWTD